MKTFKNFIFEANRYGIPEDEYQQWKRDREEGRGPVRKTFDGVEYEMRGKGTINGRKMWGVSTTASRNQSAEKRRRAESEGQLSQSELRSAAGGDEERVALARDTEETGIKKVRKRGKRIQQRTGVRQSLGHKVPLQPDEPSPEDPGHTLSNIQNEPLGPNTAKKNKRPEPGESGYGLTRSQAAQDAIQRGVRLGRKIDREVNLIRSGRESRAARLLSRLRRRKPKNTGSEERMNAAYDRRIDDLINS